MYVTHGIPSFYELLVNVSTIFQTVLEVAETLSLTLYDPGGGFKSPPPPPSDFLLSSI